MVFLSYSSQNKQLARKILEALATEGLPCWFDEQQLDAGANLRASLLSAIRESDIFVYLASDAASESKWVEDELQYAISLEFEGNLEIVPVSIAGKDDVFPALLAGRLVAHIDGTKGSIARLANHLCRRKRVHQLNNTRPLSVIIRFNKDRLLHTLNQARMHSRDCEMRVLLLDSDYESLEELYWDVSDVRFPSEVVVSAEEKEGIIKTFTEIHSQSRSIISEVLAICDRFVKTDGPDDVKSYFDAGYERCLRVLLHRLQWNTAYLRAINDSVSLDKSFIASRRLPEVFDCHRCDFVSEDRMLGSVRVPQHANPRYPTAKKPVAWGLTDPFLDMLPAEIGTAIGEIVALRFINQSLSSSEMPSPSSLMYGLS